MPPITPRPALRAYEVVLDRVEGQILDGSLGSVTSSPPNASCPAAST
jgi:hypothetical protein